MREMDECPGQQVQKSKNVVGFDLGEHGPLVHAAICGDHVLHDEELKQERHHLALKTAPDVDYAPGNRAVPVNVADGCYAGGIYGTTEGDGQKHSRRRIHAV